MNDTDNAATTAPGAPVAPETTVTSAQATTTGDTPAVAAADRIPLVDVMPSPGPAGASSSVSLSELDSDVLRNVLAAAGWDIPRDRFESALFLATRDTKAQAKTHG
ncbi:TPA: hypothetical protein I8Y21_004710 [Klebsiella oxytoca]|uniref:Uncharacterized protein n=1 Tax=Klebsiella oxytoca TaxID=571 RepID=A0AAN5LDA9_KLEOX|nr:hypothetical protein [Klebsiella oxytoca]